MQTHIILTFIAILYVMTECQLVTRYKRLWVTQTSSIAQDKFKDIDVKKEYISEKYHSSKDKLKYFHGVQNFQVIEPSVTQQENERINFKPSAGQHRFLTTRKQQKVWKIQHRWPMVHRIKRSLQRDILKNGNSHKVGENSQSEKLSQYISADLVTSSQDHNLRNILLTNKMTPDSTHQNNHMEILSVIFNNTDTKLDGNNCSLDCDERNLENTLEHKKKVELNNVNCSTNCTSVNGTQNVHVNNNVYDIELSDQPSGFDPFQLKTASTCTTNCGIIKEAESLCHSCHQVCHYIPGASSEMVGHVKCGCYHGYAIGPDWLHCIDVNECSVNSWLCHGGTCLNTIGSFLCRCRPGYQLIGHVCMDIDECTKSKEIVGMCDQVCINIPGTYQCWCHKGFTLSTTNPRSCVDINECENNVCSHSCSNTVGSFICTCPSNMRLHLDGRTCVLRPEVQDRYLEIDVNSKNIIIDGSRKIVIYGKNSTAQIYDNSTTNPVKGGQLFVFGDEHKPSISSVHNTQFRQKSIERSPYETSQIDQKDQRTSIQWKNSEIKQADVVNNNASDRKNPMKSSKSRFASLTNILPAFSSQPEVLTVNADERNYMSREQMLSKHHGLHHSTFQMPQNRYKSCIPACKNGGICDGRRKCHCRNGFQGRYCQIDVNECSSMLSLCSYVCVNTFGSYQCLCPAGYKVADDRKSCMAGKDFIQATPVMYSNERNPDTSSINKRMNYNAVIEVLVNPSSSSNDYRLQEVAHKFIQPSFNADFTSESYNFQVNDKNMKPGLHHTVKSQNKLSIENLHTMELIGSNIYIQDDLVPVITDSQTNEQLHNELRPTGVLSNELIMTMPMREDFILQSQCNCTEFTTVLNSNTEASTNSSTDSLRSIISVSRVSVTQEMVTPTLSEVLMNKYDEKVLETLFNLIVGSNVKHLIDTSSTVNSMPTQHDVIFEQNVLMSTKSIMLSEITASTIKEGVPSRDIIELLFSDNSSFTSSYINKSDGFVETVTDRSEGVQASVASYNHNEEDLSLEKDRNKETKKDQKGKGKKTKKLNHKDEKQKTRKEKKIKNKTLRKGRIKLVRLSKDYHVLNQILDASREGWRTMGIDSPFIANQRVETDWNMETPSGEYSRPGPEDRYFEVIDYDDDYFDEPPKGRYNISDPFAPIPLTLPPGGNLPILPKHWNQSKQLELDCFYGKKMIKSRTTFYRDERNCTKCICKNGELRCKPRHCPTPQCEAPLHGQCCDYCPNDCVMDNDVFRPGERFIPTVDHCRECRCVSGRAVCENVHCPALECPQQFHVLVPEECCPVCLPPEPGCFYKGRFFYEGQLWVRKEGGCQACLCKDGEVQCNPVVCVVNCQHPQFFPGECCPVCEGCQHYNHKYNDQETFPHPSDTCSTCQCQHGNITCYPKPCNIACNHPYRPSGDCCPVCRHCYFNDRKISNGASLMINNGTCQECTCKQGNITCRPAACAADCMIRGKPIPSGAEFHIGSDTCTQCRCWNGTVSCHAVECHSVCSHGVLLPHKCCLDCTKCDYQGQLYTEMQVFRPNGDSCKNCLCVKGNVMCQDTCRISPPHQ